MGRRLVGRPYGLSAPRRARYGTGTAAGYSRRGWIWLGAWVAVVGMLTACRGDGDIVEPSVITGTVGVRLAYVVGDDGQPFYRDSTYLTASDDLVRINHLKYYVSEVRLRRRDSSYWTAPGRAVLLDAGRRDTFALRGVPAGEYVELTFTIGLDSVTNARTDWGGDLAPAHEMFWAWNTGYKFLSLEGQWLGTTPAGIIEYHVGRAPMRRTLRLPLPGTAVVRAAATTQLTVAARPLVVFGGPNTMVLSDAHDRNVMFDTPQARRAADNYATMFTVTHVE